MAVFTEDLYLQLIKDVTFCYQRYDVWLSETKLYVLHNYNTTL